MQGGLPLCQLIRILSCVLKPSLKLPFSSLSPADRTWTIATQTGKAYPGFEGWHMWPRVGSPTQHQAILSSNRQTSPACREPLVVCALCELRPACSQVPDSHAGVQQIRHAEFLGRVSAQLEQLVHHRKPATVALLRCSKRGPCPVHPFLAHGIYLTVRLSSAYTG